MASYLPHSSSVSVPLVPCLVECESHIKYVLRTSRCHCHSSQPHMFHSAPFVRLWWRRTTTTNRQYMMMCRFASQCTSLTNAHTHSFRRIHKDRMRIRRSKAAKSESKRRKALGKSNRNLFRNLSNWEIGTDENAQRCVCESMCLCTILLLFRWLFFALHLSLLLRSSSSLLILFGSVLVPAHQLFVNEK